MFSKRTRSPDTLTPGPTVALKAPNANVVKTMTHTTGGTSFGPVADWMNQVLPHDGGARVAIVATDGDADDAHEAAVRMAADGRRVGGEVYGIKGVAAFL